MSWKTEIKKERRDLGVLRVGDYIFADKGRNGIVTDISISMSRHDPAGESESAYHVEKYDTSLGYNGAVSFDIKRPYNKRVSSNHWTYLGRITKIVPKEELDENDEPKE